MLILDKNEILQILTQGLYETNVKILLQIVAIYKVVLNSEISYSYKIIFFETRGDDAQRLAHETYKTQFD